MSLRAQVQGTGEVQTELPAVPRNQWERRYQEWRAKNGRVYAQ